jgi:hypothetical protein
MGRFLCVTDWLRQHVVDESSEDANEQATPEDDWRTACDHAPLCESVGVASPVTFTHGTEGHKESNGTKQPECGKSADRDHHADCAPEVSGVGVICCAIDKGCPLCAHGGT